MKNPNEYRRVAEATIKKSALLDIAKLERRRWNVHLKLMSFCDIRWPELINQFELNKVIYGKHPNGGIVEICANGYGDNIGISWVWSEKTGVKTSPLGEQYLNYERRLKQLGSRLYLFDESLLMSITQDLYTQTDNMYEFKLKNRTIQYFINGRVYWLEAVEHSSYVYMYKPEDIYYRRLINDIR